MQMCDRLKTKTLKSHAGFDCYNRNRSQPASHRDWILINGSDCACGFKAQFGATSFERKHRDAVIKQQTANIGV